MDISKWLDLQLFADGAAGDGGAGAGAGAAAPGDNAPDAGEQQLLALGVPRSKITKRASAAVGKEIGSKPPAGTGAESTKQQAAAAAATEEGSKAAQGFQIPDGFTVDDVIKHPDVNKAVQNIIGKRVKDGKANAEAMDAIHPMLEVLARSYGMDPANLDYAALSKAVENDGRYYEDMALERGVDIETAKQMDAEERANKRQQNELLHQRMQQQVTGWRQQEAQLKAEGLNIDLNTEAQNPVFMAVLKASNNVRNAYESAHHAEIVAQREAAAAATAQQQTVAQIRAGNYRPGELGGSSQAPSEMLPKTTYSPDDVNRIIEQVRKGARTGRRYAPGQI